MEECFMKKKVEIAKELFQKTGLWANIVVFETGYTLGMTGPSGIALSQERRNTKTASTQAKINATAYVLEWILQQKSKDGINAVYNYENDILYLMYRKSGSSDLECFFTDSQIIWLDNKDDNEIPPFFRRMLPCMLKGLFKLYGAGNSEVAVLDEIVRLYDENIDNGEQFTEKVLLFCDLNYFGWANQMLGKGIVYVEDPQKDYLKTHDAAEFLQAMHTGNYTALDEIAPHLKSHLAEMDNITPKQSAASQKKAGIRVTYEKCRAGEYRLNLDWKDAQCMIPDLSFLDGFVPNQAFYKAVRKVHRKCTSIIERMDAGLSGLDAIGKDYVNSLLVGRPGTGKTTMVKAICATLGIPLYTVPLSKNIEEDTFEGMTKVVDGNLTFVETRFLKCFQNGGMVVLEEVNLADPGIVMGCLGQAIEAPFLLNKNGYEEVHRHPLCVVFATMNTGTAGSRPLSQAFSSRFKNTYIIDDPSREDFIHVLTRQHQDQQDCENVYHYYKRIIEILIEQYNVPEIALSLSLRQCIGALDDMSEGSTLKEALYDTMIGKIAENDLEIANEINESVVATCID